MPTVLILRAHKDGLQTAKELHSKGFKTIIEPIFNITLLQPEVQNLEPQAIVLTSAKACPAIINAQISKQTDIFAISHQTASELIASGYSNIFYPQKSSALNLQKLLLQKLKPSGGEILYFCSNDITIDFEQNLQRLGFNANKILAYKINWHKDFSSLFLQKINEQQINSVLIYSQNSVKNFYKLAKKNNLLEYFANSKILCLSNKIAIEAKKLGFKNIGNFSEI